MNFYNEWEPYAAQWIRNLADAGHIGRGAVDERSIADIGSAELGDYRRCHFFAGIAGWEEALRLADWPADEPVWTGSCPCQDFSVAGKQEGTAGKRDLWPAFFSLIRECHPHAVFGEQVANAIGFGWLDRIHADLEGEGYTVGAVVLGAHSAGAPHIRQRLYWVADSKSLNGGANSQREKRGAGGADLQEAALLAGWPTPMAGSPATENYNEAGNTDSSRKTVALCTGWASPSSRDWKDSPGMATIGTNPDGTVRNRLDQLPRQAQLTGWATPRNVESGHSTGNPDRAMDRKSRIEDQVYLIGWPTPNAMTGGSTSRGGDRKDEKLISGLIQSPSPVPTEKRGALAPAFSLWLMGYRPEWESCAPPAMRSSRRSRQNS